MMGNSCVGGFRGAAIPSGPTGSGSPWSHRPPGPSPGGPPSRGRPPASPSTSPSRGPRRRLSIKQVVPQWYRTAKNYDAIKFSYAMYNLNVYIIKLRPFEDAFLSPGLFFLIPLTWKSYLLFKTHFRFFSPKYTARRPCEGDRQRTVTSGHYGRNGLSILRNLQPPNARVSHPLQERPSATSMGATGRGAWRWCRWSVVGGRW